VGRLAARRRASRSGQGVVEYILIAAIVVGIVYGLFEGIFKPQVERMQNRIKEESTAVLRQRPLGIPIAWFGFNQPDFDAVSAQLTGGPQGGSGGDGEGGSGSRGGDRGDDGGEGGGRDGGGGDGGGSGPRRPTDNSSGLGPAGGGGGTSTAANEDDEGEAAKKGGRRGRAGGGDQEEGEAASGSTSSAAENAGEESAENGEKKSGDGEGPPARAKRADQVREEQGGNCSNFNVFTLLKVAAIIAIFLLLAAVFVTGRGQKGSD